MFHRTRKNSGGQEIGYTSHYAAIGDDKYLSNDLSESLLIPNNRPRHLALVQSLESVVDLIKFHGSTDKFIEF